MPVVEIRGNSDLRLALRRFAPDLDKQLKKELGLALRPVVKKAKSFVEAESPMSGWSGYAKTGKFPKYDAVTIRRGITYTTAVSKPTKDGFTSMARIVNKSPVGAIYELAGLTNPNGQRWVGPKAGGSSKGVSRSVNPQAGKQFIANLPPLTSSLKGRGRLIYRAWRDSRGVAEYAANKAIDAATTEFFKRSQSTRFKRVA
jgi:hypothetical protein